MKKMLALIFSGMLLWYFSPVLSQQMEMVTYPNWLVEKVDESQIFLYNVHSIISPDIDIDVVGYPHIAYGYKYDNNPGTQGQWKVRYASYEGGEWMADDVWNLVPDHEYEPPTNLILPDGNTNDPRILWTQCPPRYNYREAGEWRLEIVDEEQLQNCRPGVSMAVDNTQQKRHHISYPKWTDRTNPPCEVRYAYRTGDDTWMYWFSVNRTKQGSDLRWKIDRTVSALMP